jgi:hypothetical protein
MQKNVYSTFQVLIVLIIALSGTALAIDVGRVRQVYSTSHTEDTPSNNPYIQIKWYPPENGLADGYYVLFNTQMTHTFDEFNTADEAVELIRNETQVTSQNFSGADGVNYYCHIAAFVLDTNDKEFIGETVSEGPFPIDTVPPLMPVVNAPNAVRNRMITIQPGAYRANEMYISNVGFELNGQWEDFAQKRQWELRDIQGNQMIYIVFRDLAGNTSRATAAIRYDTIGPIAEFITSETMPARSSPMHITIVFDEPVTQFSDTDIQTSNCEIQNFIADQPDLSSRFFLECTPFTQGTIQLSILENVLEDEAGNANQPCDAFQWIYDTSLPQIQSINDQMIIENAGSKSIAFSITNSNAFNGRLTIDAWAENSSLVDQQGLEVNSQGNPFDISLTAGSTQSLDLKITPRQDQSGETIIHVLVSDATGMTAHTSFQLNIWDAPNISPIPDLQMEESTSYSIAIVLTDVYKQNLVLSMTTSNPALMGTDHMTVIGPVFNSIKFPYNCQTSNHATISLDLYFEPPKNEYGKVNITLTATNTKDLSQTRAFKLDILQRNDLPELVMASSARCFEDQTAKIPVAITDIDQDELVVTALSSNESLISKNDIRWMRNGKTYHNPISIPLQSTMTQDLILKIQPAADAYGDATITVRAEDHEGFTEKSLQLIVLSDNDPPVSPESISFTINENVLNGTKVGNIPVSDVDSLTLTYAMDQITPIDHFRLNSMNGDITVNGNIDYESISLYQLTVHVSDPYSHSTTLVNIHVANMNDHPPQIEDSLDLIVQENTAIGTTIKTIMASDVDEDPLSYTLTFETASVPFAISRHTGELWIKNIVDYETQSLYSSILTVSDSAHQTSCPLTITVTDTNEAPVISGTPALTVIQGQEYSFQPITFDPDTNDQLFFYITGLPPWADLDKETGQLSGKPTNEHVGIWKNISIFVRDNSNLSVSLPLFNITVINANDPPILNKPIADVSVDKNNEFSYTIPQDTFLDPDSGDILSYQATEFNKDQLPAWLNFDPVTLHFSGKPGMFDGGIFIIQVTAVDSYLTATATSFKLTVIDHNIVPIITLPAHDIDFYENNDAAIIDKFARIEDEDSLNYDKGVLYASIIKNGTSDDHLQIKDYGFGITPIGLDENKVYSGEQLIGTFSGGIYPEPLSVTFTHWASKDIVTSLLRNIMFVNDSENPVDGERRLMVTVSDGDGGTSAPVYKTINVHATNDNPVLMINDQVIEISDPYSLPNISEAETIVFENDRRIQVDDKDSGDGILTVSISAVKGIISLNSENIKYFKEVTGNKTSNVTCLGTLEQINAGLDAITYTNHINAFGKESLLFSLNDNGHSGSGGGEFVKPSITFRINEVNDPPHFSTILPQVLMEETAAQIAFTITETDYQNVVVQIKNFEQDMICADSIFFEGPLLEEDFIINTSESDHAHLTLNLKPCQNKTGNTFITLIVNDGVHTETRNIDIYITPINDAPIVSDQSLTMKEDCALSKALSISDTEEDFLQLTLMTPPKHGHVELDSINQRFIYTPQKNETESVYFTYLAHDDASSSNIGRVDITIIPVNDPPEIDAITDQTFISLQTRAVEFWVSDVDSDDINVSATSSNTQIIPNNQAYLSLIKNNYNQYTLYMKPIRDKFGTTTITITATDSEQASGNETFKVYVKQVDNQGPVISLNSPDVVQMDQNDTYIEPGYSAIDDIDGDISDSVTTQSDLNPKIPGIYHILYHAIDAAGNNSEPAERMVLVHKNQFTTQKISGNIVDDAGESVGWVDIVVTGQGYTYNISSIYNGFFELALPITFDGSVWQMRLTRNDFYTQTLEFSSPRTFERITLLSKESNNAEVIKGQCFEHQVDGTHTVLPQVTIRVRSIESGELLATGISDNNGHYTLAVDVRSHPYSFEAVKYGYESQTFATNATSTIILMPITTIIVEQPESSTDHTTARHLGKVSIFVSAIPPFNDENNELIANLLAESSKEISLVKNYIENDCKYKLEYSRYGDFSVTLRADTTEDRNANNNYFVEKTLHFKSVEKSAHVFVTKGETQYLITQPFYIEQSDLSSFIWIDRGGLSGVDIPRKLNYTIRNYNFPLEDKLYDHVVEFELHDAFGREINMVDHPICLGIGFDAPVTRDNLNNQTYELIHAETVQDLLSGQGLQVESSFSIFEKHVSLCTSHLSAFGFRKSENQENKSGSGNDSGGCFLMTIP